MSLARVSFRRPDQSPASVLAVAVLVIAGLAACDIRVRDGQVSVDVAETRADEVWRRSYTLAAGETLAIDNANGAVRVEATAGPAVEIEAERSARAASPEEARRVLDGITVTDETTPGRVRVSTAVPSGLLLADAEVRFRVKVPAGVRLEARTANGGIELTDVVGDVVVSTVNGGVQGTVGAVSRLEARSTNGGVRLTMRARPAEGARVTLDTTNGGIWLVAPPDLTADVAASCVTGRISIEGFTVDGQVAPRRVDGRLHGGGGATLALSTTNGGIRVIKASAAGAAAPKD